MPTVLNMKRLPMGSLPSNAVYVGRPTKWGNPFQIGLHGGRTSVIERYRHYLFSHPYLLDAVRRELRGKDLICWCAPAPCHADILLEVANSESPIASATTTEPSPLSS